MELSLFKHMDSEYGWLAVKKNLIDKLGINDQISTDSRSSESGKTWYLDEKVDESVFVNKAINKGYTLNIKQRYTDGSSQIRSYTRVNMKKD